MGTEPMTQYRVVTRYEGHPVLGDWESSTRRPMTREQAEKFVEDKRAYFNKNQDFSKVGKLVSLEMEEIGGLKGLNFNDNEMTVEYWSGNDLNAPCVELRIDTGRKIYDRDWGTSESVEGSYDLTMDEAENLYEFLREALERAGRIE